MAVWRRGRVVGLKTRKGARTSKILSRDDHDVTEEMKKKEEKGILAVEWRQCIQISLLLFVSQRSVRIAACASIRSGERERKGWGKSTEDKAEGGGRRGNGKENEGKGSNMRIVFCEIGLWMRLCVCVCEEGGTGQTKNSSMMLIGKCTRQNRIVRTHTTHNTHIQRNPKPLF